MKFREELIEAANTASNAFMDESIKSYYFFHHITKEVESGESSYLNVPVSSIKGLKNFYHQNWRQAVPELKCEGWDKVSDEIEKYFLSKVKGRLFPTPNSKGELTLNIIGNIAYCEIGNHRVIAAKAWLLKFHENNAVLYNISCSRRYLKPSVRDFFNLGLSEKWQFSFAEVPDLLYGAPKYLRDHCIYEVMRVKKGKHTYFYEIIDFRGKPDLLPIDRNWKSIFRQDCFSKCRKLKYVALDHSLIRDMCDDTANWAKN